MLRVVLLAAAAALMSSAQAQTPDPGQNSAKTVKAHAVLKGGGRIEVHQPDIVGRELCGFMLPADAPADAIPKADCIAMSEIASTEVEGGKIALAESTEGVLCVVLKPLCLAKVSAVQNRIVEKAIDKAKAR